MLRVRDKRWPSRRGPLFTLAACSGAARPLAWPGLGHDARAFGAERTAAYVTNGRRAT